MSDQPNRILSAVVFTDIQGYSAITHEDESRALAMITSFKETVDRCTVAHHGEIINYLGDGSLSIHSSAKDAVACAIEMQQHFHNEASIPVRIGVHMGDIVKRDNSIFGDAVNIAARIQDLCPPGAVLLTDRIASEIRNQSEIDVVFLGPERVKNISDPIPVYSVHQKGLYTATPRDIHRANKARTRGRRIYQVAAIVLLAAFVISLVRNRVRNAEAITEDRLMVLPFTNETGDTSLSHIGNFASRSISRVIEQTGEARIIPFDSVSFLVSPQQMSVLPIAALAKGYGASNVISGSYTMDDDDNIVMQCTLYEASNMEPLVGFPVSAAPLESFRDAVSETATRIAGYWTTKDIGYVAIPTLEANRAFEIALKYWTRDYEKAIQYLDRAIELDSTFLDAYYWKMDGLYNLNRTEEALEVLSLVESKFDVVTFNETQFQTFQFYEYHLSGQRVEAFNILRSYYQKDPEDLLNNTTAASLALLWLNEPEYSLELLSVIPIDSIDFRSNMYFQRRLRIAMRDHNLLGQFREALEVAEYFPRPIKDPLYPRMVTRSYAGLRDTNGINRMIELASMEDSPVSPKKIALIAADWLVLQGDSTLAARYYKEYMDRADIDLDYLYSMYHCGQQKEALDKLSAFVESMDLTKFPFDGLHCLVTGYVLNGEFDKARDIIEISQSSDIEPHRKSYSIAKLYAAVGEGDLAAAYIERSIAEGYLFLSGRYDEDVHLRSIRNSRAYNLASHPRR